MGYLAVSFLSCFSFAKISFVMSFRCCPVSSLENVMIQVLR
jgi:hypothetical protein